MNKKLNEKNEKYWRDREEQKLKSNLKDINKLEKELYEEYKAAAKNIQKEISILFDRYAKDNNLTYAEASKYLNGKEFKAFRYDLQKYIELIEETGDERLLLELNTLAMKSRISRLEEVLYQCEKHVNNLAITTNEKLTETYTNTVSKCYYQTIYDTHKKIGVATSFALVDDDLVKSILEYPWSGATFSELIWNNVDNLKKELKKGITQMVIQGTDSRKIAKDIAEKMYDTSNRKEKRTAFKNAMRVVNTEHSYVMSESTNRAYKELNVKKYQFLASLDERTCSICGNIDLEIFNVDEKQSGVNASPMHPRLQMY